MIDTSKLKPGDEVAVWYAGRDVFPRYTIEVVKTITPTGQVRLVDGRRFNAEGEKMGDKRWQFGSDLLELLTDQLRKEIADSSAIETIRDFTRNYDVSRWSMLPTDALRRIAEIIRENTGGNHAG